MIIEFHISFVTLITNSDTNIETTFLVLLCFLSKMDLYLENATIHGFFYLKKKNTICTKLFWLSVTLGAFIFAGKMISYTFNDWEEHQTITTLDSIAVPIEEVQFPTVTVCPNPESPPDNWSYLEKILNIFETDGLK